MDGGHGESSGLLVGVVELVEVFVEEGHVVDSVVPVGDVVGGNEDQGTLHQSPEQSMLTKLVVERGAATIDHPTSQSCRQC